MKIVVFNGSPRKKGNTEIMVDTFISGAKESGHSVEKFNLGAMSIGPCHACEYCFSHRGECVQKDDMPKILKAVDTADMLVLASPIYWFSMSGQIKTTIDRLYARSKQGFHITKTALLLNAYSEGVFDGAIAQYKGTNDYLKWEDMGIVAISGMTEKGMMEKSPELKKV